MNGRVRECWREAARAAAVGALACGPILLALRDLVPGIATRIAPRNTDVALVLWLLDWGAERWADGLRGFWDAPFFFPTRAAMAFSEHMLLPSALMGAVRAAGGSAAAGYNLLLVSSFSLTSIGVYLLLRGAVRARPWLVAILALAVVHAPWRWGQLAHLQMLWAPGPPLAILFFDRLLHRPGRGRAAAFLGAYSATLLSGGYLAYFTHTALAATLVLRLGRGADRHRLGARWRMLAVTFALGVALGAAIYLPYISASRELRLVRSAAEMLALGARPTDWLAPSAANLYSGAVPRPWLRPEGALFPGFLLGVGALGGLAGLAMRPRRRRAALPLLGRAVVLSGALLAVVEFGAVFARFATVVPGLAGLRAPTRVHFFVLLAAAVLAGSALGSARRRFGARSPMRLAPFAALPLLVLEAWVRPIPQGAALEPERAEQLPPHVRWLGSHPVRAVAHLPFVSGEVEVARMWRARFHHRPIANGHSGYLARTFLYFRRECRTPMRAISSRCLDALDALGISHLVVEDAFRGLEPGDLRGRLDAALRKDAGQRAVLEFADDEALVLALRARGAGAVSFSDAAAPRAGSARRRSRRDGRRRRPRRRPNPGARAGRRRVAARTRRE